MQSCLLPLGSVLVTSLLLTDVVGVRRPDYLSNARVAPEYVEETFGREVKVKTGRNEEPHSGLMTRDKCCKVGERVAKEGMYCSYDLHVVSRQPNFIHRYKLKLYNQDESKKQVREYKSLTLRITKCFPYKDMFEKCCNYRSSYLMSMRRCREMRGRERKQCRLKTRKTFGF